MTPVCVARRAAVAGVAVIALQGLNAVTGATADAAVAPATASIGAFIGCGQDANGNGVVIFHGNGTGLPARKSVTIDLNRWGTGSGHVYSDTTLTTSSTGAVSTPTHTGSDLATSDFGYEYLTVTITSGATVYGSKTASIATCLGAGGTWGARKPIL